MAANKLPLLHCAYVTKYYNYDYINRHKIVYKVNDRLRKGATCIHKQFLRLFNSLNIFGIMKIRKQ